jgi:hypothetical protein
MLYFLKTVQIRTVPVHFKQCIPDTDFWHWFENFYFFYKLLQDFVFVYHILICNETVTEIKFLLSDGVDYFLLK